MVKNAGGRQRTAAPQRERQQFTPAEIQAILSRAEELVAIAKAEGDQATLDAQLRRIEQQQARVDRDIAELQSQAERYLRAVDELTAFVLNENPDLRGKLNTAQEVARRALLKAAQGRTPAQLRERQQQIEQGNAQPNAADLFFQKTGTTYSLARKFLDRSLPARLSKLGDRKLDLQRQLKLAQTKRDAVRMRLTDRMAYESEAKQVVSNLRRIRKQVGKEGFGMAARRLARQMTNAWGDSVKIAPWREAAQAAGVSKQFAKQFGGLREPATWKQAARAKVVSPARQIEARLSQLQRRATTLTSGHRGATAAQRDQLRREAIALKRQVQQAASDLRQHGQVMNRFQASGAYVPGISLSTLSSIRTAYRQQAAAAQQALSRLGQATGITYTTLEIPAAPSTPQRSAGSALRTAFTSGRRNS